MTKSIAHIVDDDAGVCDALVWLLKSRGVASRVWSAPQDFLDQLDPRVRGCIVLDVRMPGMNGIELYDRVRSAGCMLPVIFLTGHGDVPMAVEAIKNGAFDFLEKPYDDNALVDKIISALELDSTNDSRHQSLVSVRHNLEQLTAREREVMDMVLTGKLNKVIADELGIAMRTVEVHRSRIFEKMGVRSAVELSQRLRELDDKSDRSFRLPV